MGKSDPMNQALPPPEKRCLHFDVCQLNGDFGAVGKEGRFCILHLPQPKSVSDLNAAIQQHLAAGRSDFRHVYFHGDATTPFQKVKFPGLVDFRGAVFPTGLQMEGADLPRGLMLNSEMIAAIRLAGITIDGPVVIEFNSCSTVDLAHARLSEGLTLKLKDSKAVGLNSISVEGPFEMHATGTIEAVDLRSATISRQLAISSQALSRLELFGASLFGPVDIKLGTGGHLYLVKAKFHKEISIDLTESQVLSLGWSELGGLVVVRGRFQDCVFSMATVRQGLDLQGCTFLTSPAFDGITYDPKAQINLSGSSVTGDLKIYGSPVPPKAIVLDNCRIKGTTVIESELGARSTQIIARKQRPLFEGDVTFNNVDLRESKLVGNAVTRMNFTNVRWARRFGRNVLYDEVAMRKGEAIPVSNLKETYQILKQKYHEKGDNATAGDFHYGEMEMRRREYGWPKRVLSPEFLYWALSGYGIGYIRALFVLFLLVLLFAGLYLWSDSAAFSARFSESLLFSIQVTTLQRPSVPVGFALMGRWLHTAQMVLGPLQIALFALALRMRLKR